MNGRTYSSSLEYWADRALLESASKLRSDLDIYKKLKLIYDTTFNQIQAQIDGMYNRVATKQGIDKEALKKVVSEFDVVEFQERARELVISKDFSDEANKMLSLYNLKMRQTYLEMNENNIRLAIAEGGNEVQKLIRSALLKEFNNENTLQAGILQKIIGSPTRMKLAADTFINNPYQGALWSERIWENQANLGLKVDKAMRDIVFRGKNPRDLLPILKKDFGVSSKVAYRLAVTEMARIQSEVQLEHLKYNDFEQYKYLAEPGACEECKKIANQIFYVKDAQIGLNMSPLHPH